MFNTAFSPTADQRRQWAEALRLLVSGDAVTTYNEGGEQYEVHVRAEADDRGSEAGLGRLPIPSRVGTVALEDVARLTRGEESADIRRLSRQRQVTVMVNLLPGTSQAAVQSQMTEFADQLGMAPGYTGGFSGQSRELNRTATAFLTAFALSLIFIYLVLAAQFESWLHPVTILLSLPLTLPFALLSLIIFQQSLNVFPHSACWCCSGWLRRTQSSRSIMPTSSRPLASVRATRSCRPAATACGRF